MNEDITENNPRIEHTLTETIRMDIIKDEEVVSEQHVECNLCLRQGIDCYNFSTRKTDAGTPLPHLLCKYTQFQKEEISTILRYICKTCFSLLNVLEDIENQYNKLRVEFQTIICKNPLFEIGDKTDIQQLPEIIVKKEIFEFTEEGDIEEDPISLSKNNLDAVRNTWLDSEQCVVKEESGTDEHISDTEVTQMLFESATQTLAKKSQDGLQSSPTTDVDNENREIEENNTIDNKLHKLNSLDKSKNTEIIRSEKCRAVEQQCTQQCDQPLYDTLISSIGTVEWRCETCNKLYPTKAAVQRHARKHNHTQQYQCSHCDKSFKHSRWHRAHEATHAAHATHAHACSQCPRTFVIAAHLRRHARTHSDERPHECEAPGCERRFSERYNLVAHMRTHEPRPPRTPARDAQKTARPGMFRCGDCPQRFVRRYMLERHRAEAHGDRQEARGDRQETPGDHQEAPGDRQETPGDHQEAPGDRQETPGDHQEAPGEHTHVGADEEGGESADKIDRENKSQNTPDDKKIIILSDKLIKESNENNDDDSLNDFNGSGDSDYLPPNDDDSSESTDDDEEEIETEPNGEVVSNSQKGKCIRKNNFCFYCKELVSNFSPHLIREHSMQTEVQQIISYPKGHVKRSQLLKSLRDRGNYILNSRGLVKPMWSNPLSSQDDYLPCTFCFGFYKKKQLWRHRKFCTEKPHVESKNAQIEGPNILLHHLQIDNKLKQQVFPRMKADNISLVAKKDPLICAFGAEYLKTHRKKNFIFVASRRMRALAKLLIELQKQNVNIKTLSDALQPHYYYTIVEAIKVAALYNKESNKYDSPSYPAYVVTSLKQCANIALKKKYEYFKADSGEAETNIKNLIAILTANWKYDIFSQ